MKRADLSTMPPFFDRYILRVGEGVELLQGLHESLQRFQEFPFQVLEPLGRRTYAPDKWSAKDVLQHIIDTERIQSYRAMRFARNDKTILPGFDEEFFAKHTTANDRKMKDMVAEFLNLRRCNIDMFKSFGTEVLYRTGTAFEVEISVAALGFVLVGHLEHHLEVLRQRYIPLLSQ